MRRAERNGVYSSDRACGLDVSPQCRRGKAVLARFSEPKKGVQEPEGTFPPPP